MKKIALAIAMATSASFASAELTFDPNSTMGQQAVCDSSLTGPGIQTAGCSSASSLLGDAAYIAAGAGNQSILSLLANIDGEVSNSAIAVLEAEESLNGLVSAEAIALSERDQAVSDRADFDASLSTAQVNVTVAEQDLASYLGGDPVETANLEGVLAGAQAALSSLNATIAPYDQNVQVKETAYSGAVTNTATGTGVLQAEKDTYESLLESWPENLDSNVDSAQFNLDQANLFISDLSSASATNSTQQSTLAGLEATNSTEQSTLVGLEATNSTEQSTLDGYLSDLTDAQDDLNNYIGVDPVTIAALNVAIDDAQAEVDAQTPIAAAAQAEVDVQTPIAAAAQTAVNEQTPIAAAAQTAENTALSNVNNLTNDVAGFNAALADALDERDTLSAYDGNTENPAAVLFNTAVADGAADVQDVVEAIDDTVQLTVDNDAEIQANTDSIVANDGDIQANTDSIVENDGDIQANTDSIVANDGDIQANTDSIVANDGDIQANTDSIVANDAEHSSAITINKTAIATETVNREAAVLGLQNNINSNTVSINNNTAAISTLSEDLDVVRSGVAATLAVAGMPLAPTEGWGAAIGTGYFDGESAVAAGLTFRSDRYNFKFAVGTSGGETTGSAGVSWGF